MLKSMEAEVALTLSYLLQPGKQVINLSEVPTINGKLNSMFKG
jgi:hypothetical protein